MTRTKLRSGVYLLVDTGAPTDGTSGTGAGLAGPGSIYVRTSTNVTKYVNRGTKASPSWRPEGQVVTVVAAGRNGAGAVTATGFKVGDRVVAAINHTDGTDGIASFESVITVVDQIQQSSASNLTSKTFFFQVQH
jgi:hypothetical protein